MIPEREVILNNQDGRKYCFIFREYMHGDEKEIRNCIEDEYGDTYLKKWMYQKEYIWEKVRKHEVIILVAQVKEYEIAGILLLEQFYPMETMCELGSETILKKYRGFGLAMELFQYGMKVILSKQYSAAYCRPVLYHNITQRLLYRIGFRVTGFRFNAIDVEKEKHSYENGRNRKASIGIQIRPVNKWNAGKLYLPKEHEEFCKSVYDSLHVKYQIASVLEKEETAIENNANIRYQYNVEQDELLVDIANPEENVKTKLEMILTEFSLKGKRTASVFINCNHPNAVSIYTWLEEKGFFFSGLKPLCSENEYLVMHYAGEVKIYFEDFIVSDEFKNMLDYIGDCYEKKQN